jgi:hypothetical protein
LGKLLCYGNKFDQGQRFKRFSFEESARTGLTKQITAVGDFDENYVWTKVG